MKRILVVLSLVLVFSALTTGFLGNNVEAAESKKQKENVENVENMKKMLEVLKETEAEFDLTKIKKQEQKIYDGGRYIGTIGIEPASAPQTSDGGFSTLGSYDLSNGYNYWKVYWYSGSVNFHFYTKIYISSSSGDATISSVYDKWKAVSPPYEVKSDVLSIVRKYETYTLPAEARYTLTLTSIYGGEWDIYLYAKVFNKKLTTGTN